MRRNVRARSVGGLSQVAGGSQSPWISPAPSIRISYPSIPVAPDIGTFVLRRGESSSSVSLPLDTSRPRSPDMIPPHELSVELATDVETIRVPTCWVAIITVCPDVRRLQSHTITSSHVRPSVRNLRRVVQSCRRCVFEAQMSSKCPEVRDHVRRATARMRSGDSSPGIGRRALVPLYPGEKLWIRRW
ncbi:hypothetical protein K466DRAFT_335921 [Polyporus arcularius HHB13444]|uniref:Uncharacterized protein n=1 Tax=Polyporus arcularius HHB13444 TaxID=1314778 RepID=A0A5C3NZQ1_9APHY|nr:hypothetical protein K466DRAFT_335921 [Polyporus arcularius HHB13444]